MKNIETRKTIALGLALAYIIFTGISMITKVEVPQPFVALVGLVVGSYYGKSTALEMPKTPQPPV